LHCDLAITYPFSADIISTMELNYRWRDKVKRQQRLPAMLPGVPTFGPVYFDTTINEKSGHALFLSPGFQFILYKDIRLKVGVQIPLIKPEDGWAEKFVVHFGLTSFFERW
jgi:hypothetical protein